MRTARIDLSSTLSCDRQLAAERRHSPFFGVVDIELFSPDVGSVRIRMIDLNDDYVAKSFSNEDCYEPLMIREWLAHAARVRGAVLDIGSSTGLYSLLASVVNRQVTVHAFEPYSRAVARLVNNKDLNALPKISIHSVAVGSKPGVSEFTLRNFEGPITTGGSLVPGGRTEKVVVRVELAESALGEKEVVELVKLDVEGFELEVLKTLRSRLSRSMPTVFFEALTSDALTEICELLQPLGYGIYAIDEQQKVVVPLMVAPNQYTARNFIAKVPTGVR